MYTSLSAMHVHRHTTFKYVICSVYGCVYMMLSELILLDPLCVIIYYYTSLCTNNTIIIQGLQVE